MLEKSQFKPVNILKNRHLQTLWGTLFKGRLRLPCAKRLRLELTDGDFIDVDYFNNGHAQTVMLLHGLEGSRESHYIEGVGQSLLNAGYNLLIKHFRGCSGDSNRLLKSYHSGASDDLEVTLQELESQGIKVDYLCGFSLGGNVLLKWLGESNESIEKDCRLKSRIKGAVAVSVPLMLCECADSIDKGFSKFYQWHLLSSLKKKALRKLPDIQKLIKLSATEIKEIKNFRQFDHFITAPLNGFSSANDYYQKVSSRQFLRGITVPTLIIHAKDDPFMTENVIPNNSEMSDSVSFELSEHGGHVGFVDYRKGVGIDYYLEHRIVDYFKAIDPID